jgi:hypothetical protein
LETSAYQNQTQVTPATPERKLGDLAVKELMRSLMGNVQQSADVSQWHPGFGSLHRKHHRCLTCLICGLRSTYIKRRRTD